VTKKKNREHSVTRNKKAFFEYAIEETFEAGIVLTGAEIKSIRAKKVSISEGYCFFDDKQVFKIRGMRIAEFKNAGYVQQNPDRDKCLLLTKNELKKITNKLKDQGITVIPIEVFISPKGFAKLEIGLGKGKKIYDKRESLKDKDIRREINNFT
jgi:SsrA-binding protein